MLQTLSFLKAIYIIYYHIIYLLYLNVELRYVEYLESI